MTTVFWILLWVVLSAGLGGLFWLNEASEARMQKAAAAWDRGQLLWFAACVALAAPVVSFLEDDLHQGVVLLVDGVFRPVAALVFDLGNQLREIGTGHSGSTSLQDLLLAFGGTGVAVILFLIASILGLRVAALGTIAVVIPCAAIYWMRDSLAVEGAPSPVAHVIFYGYGGTLLYGIVLPVLWLGIEPFLRTGVSAPLLQRLKLRIWGAPRYSQPIYVMLGVLSLAAVVGRVLEPISRSLVTTASLPNPQRQAESGVADTDSRGDDRLQFTVANKDKVSTGIVLDAQEEIFLQSTGQVIVQFGVGHQVMLPPSNAALAASPCPLPLADPGAKHGCFDYRAGSPSGGPVTLLGNTAGSAEPAVVTIRRAHEPATRYRWLAPGTRLPLNIESQPYYCAGPGLSLVRFGGKEVRTALTPVPSCQPDKDKDWPKLPRLSGEIHVGHDMTWFGGLSADRHFLDRQR